MTITLKKDQKLPKLADTTEKDIMYAMRTASDSIGSYNDCSDEYKEKFQQSIIKRLKAKEFDYYAKDIDNNILLTYAIYNKHLKVAQYMLDNHYDLLTFREDVKNAIVACVLLDHNERLNFLLDNYELHPKYKEQIVLKSYIFACRMTKEENKNQYLDNANKLVDAQMHFNTIMFQLIESRETEHLEGIVEMFLHFLDLHPLPKAEKIALTDELLDKPFHRVEMKKYQIEDKRKVYENWKLVHTLEKDLKDTNNHSSTKMKL
jgi:glycine cleavage system protein P-like pyridoxal-binding family